MVSSREARLAGLAAIKSLGLIMIATDSKPPHTKHNLQLRDLGRDLDGDVGTANI
jgi:hypothetical protein